jgi:hypothetical protein
MASTIPPTDPLKYCLDLNSLQFSRISLTRHREVRGLREKLAKTEIKVSDSQKQEGIKKFRERVARWQWEEDTKREVQVF